MDFSKNHQLSSSTPSSYEHIEEASMFLNVLIDNRKMSSTIVSRLGVAHLLYFLKVTNFV